MFEELRRKYSKFIYEKYEIEEYPDKFISKCYFSIPGLATFIPSVEIEKKYIKNPNINKDLVDDIVLAIGMVELISYWKCTMPLEVEIKAGYLSEDQLSWFKKLYYHGLGEFMYQNKIHVSYDDFMHITCTAVKKDYDVTYEGKGNLIAVGGGKDSCVSIHLLNDFYLENDLLMLNPKKVHFDTASIDGYQDKIFPVKRTIDPKLLELNAAGFLNGHTPFSALLSFISLLSAYLGNKKYIVLSNESSANEASVKGTNINHQYSKGYEYECDFNYYVKEYLKIDITYFSLLRPLLEVQIAKLFSKYEKYHTVFRSCNLGSKDTQWSWCGKCGKCLFIYGILSPFLKEEQLIAIFGQNLFADESLLDLFIDLTGKGKHKPFECVGTYEEFNYAISKTILKYQGDLPYLLKYYKENYPLVQYDEILSFFNEENNVPEEFIKLVRRAINE